MLKSPSMVADAEHQAEVGSVIRRDRADKMQAQEISGGELGVVQNVKATNGALNQQLDEEFKHSDIRYMQAKDQDLIRRVLADCNYIDKSKML